MDAKQFLAEFGHIVSTPNGIKQIRELILHLAVSGNITSRIPGDIDATELIIANKKKQKQLISLGELKRQHSPLKTQRER